MPAVNATTSDRPVDLVLDVDSHEMIPLEMWPDVFGPIGATVGELVRVRASQTGDNSVVRPDLQDDSTPINDETVWDLKGPSAPSAIDLARRPDVLAQMGIGRQLVFPTFALIGLLLAFDPKAWQRWQFDRSVDAKGIGAEAVRAHNTWAAAMTALHGADHFRIVGVLVGDEPADVIANAEEVLASGVRAVWLPSGEPLGGTSPADPSFDPLWAMLAEARVPALLHLGTESALVDERWHANVPAFRTSIHDPVEFPLDPYRSANVNLSQENYLNALVFGGVFERHPELRFGVIECAAHWVGPLAEKLDLWATQYRKRLAGLSIRPSEYLARNVRATPFVFEPIDRYIERHPDLVDVYCFSTDYPHVEGGRYARRTFEERLARLDSTTQQKFFVENATWLLPD